MSTATFDYSGLTTNRTFTWPDAAGTVSLLGNTSTGSGSVVLATATTLTNPIVGTQSAGDNSTKAASTAYVDGSFMPLAGGTFAGNVKLGTAGNGLYVKEGSNATMGVTTLVLGTKVISTNKVTANSRIFLMTQSLGTVTVPSALAVSARTAATSFTILASDLTDTSVVAWLIVEPA
jgi:hypothetical protein